MIRLVLTARALRGFADGCIAVVLPAYLLALGHGELEVGLISTATLFGSAFTTLAVGRWGHRFPIRRLMLAAALLMAATGAALAASVEVALACLLARSLLSQMDVPARGAFVMSVVMPEERPAAASFTSVPRSLAAAASPALTGALFAAGAMAAPLVICAVLKIAYDVALFAAFRRAELRR